ncbi:hypothetical protein FE697_018735 [Mumia zhuanghuii]|uniref:Lipoprotein n=2 Tax=Mumia TaxID=1546255 RepID=A0ABW1QJH1_9ACTN|nr:MULTISPECIES: hypothetical protein [Mumia]KAA1419932.1 hypothetical protein FE697_018735 [Mumia zhuanghuii]
MSIFSGRSPLRAAPALGGAIAVLLTLSGCSGDDDSPSSGPTTAAPPSLSSLGELDGLTMIDTSWEEFRTAKVTEVTGRPDARAVDVAFEASDAACEALAGYASQRDEDEVRVTIVIGQQEGCEPGAVVAAKTSVPLARPLGDAQPVASAYSKESIEIG